jgi:hypothetical protein
VLLAAGLALAASPGGAPPAPAASAGSEDEFKVFDADLGRAWIDVSAYPPEQQKSYALFAQKCIKCHTLARPINSSLQAGDWSAYVNRMSRKSGSGISPHDGETILSFLLFDSARRTRAAVVLDPELVPFLEVGRELSGVKRFPASKQDIRAEEGPLRVTVDADPRMDLSCFFASEGGQKLVKWTRREPNRGELVLTGEAAAAGKAPAPPAATNAAVRAASAEAVGDAVDARERVERILDWLDEKMKREYRQGVGDPAAILADRRGDATEFTRLFVAMARASGIPARARVGFVARRTGFFFHAWAEVWLDRWVAVDPYLGQLPADRTHIVVVTPGDDALAGWDARAVPGLDRLQFRVVIEKKPEQGGG